MRIAIVLAATVAVLGLGSAWTTTAASKPLTTERANRVSQYPLLSYPNQLKKVRVERCRSARAAVPYYRERTHYWQLKRYAQDLADHTPIVRGKSCRWARFAADEHVSRSVAARKTYEKWVKSFSYRGKNPNVVLGQRMAAAYGWHVGPNWDALFDLWNYESGWDHSAVNSSSGVCGIPQSATGCFGYSPSAQIAWGLNYIKVRYGTPANAWAIWNARYPHWY